MSEHHSFFFNEKIQTSCYIFTFGSRDIETAHGSLTLELFTLRIEVILSHRVVQYLLYHFPICSSQKIMTMLYLRLVLIIFFSSWQRLLFLLLEENHGAADAFHSVAVVSRHDSRRKRIYKSTTSSTGTTLATATTLASSTSNDKHSSSNNNNNKAADDADDDDDNDSTSFSFRFLGRGRNAIVRPGCVLVAPSNEYHHFYRRAAIFIYGMGVDAAAASANTTPNSKDDREDETVDVDFLIRGLIIDFPTPFTLAEMMNHNARMVSNPLGNNFLFRGGDKGGDGVILLHNNPPPHLPPPYYQGDGITVYKITDNDSSDSSSSSISNNEIGTSGIYQGGWDAALGACQTAATDSRTSTNVVNNYKAFFNYCEFTEKELEDMLDSRGTDGNDDDVWMSVEVDADFILNQDWDRGDAWKRLRKVVRLQEEK
jgi:hypothetical protein